MGGNQTREGRPCSMLPPQMTYYFFDLLLRRAATLVNAQQLVKKVNQTEMAREHLALKGSPPDTTVASCSFGKLFTSEASFFQVYQSSK